jgi:hypothetical protein
VIDRVLPPALRYGQNGDGYLRDRFLKVDTLRQFLSAKNYSLSNSTGLSAPLPLNQTSLLDQAALPDQTAAFSTHDSTPILWAAHMPGTSRV